MVLLALEAFVRRPSFDQRAIDGEVLIGHETGSLRSHWLKKLLSQFLVEPSVAVLAENRMVPYRSIDLQADEPAEQQIVVELFHEQSLPPHRVEHLQQQGAEQPFRWDGGTTHLRVQPFEVLRPPPQNFVGQLAYLPQRVMAGDTLLQRYLAGHPGLPLIVVASHLRARITCSRFKS